MEKPSEKTQELVPRSFSCDGYEQLHEEAMDNISVSIQYSDNEETLSKSSQYNLVNEKSEKKMKISLSQEQLRLNVNSRNFLTISGNNRKSRAPSVSTAEIHNGSKSVREDSTVPILIDSKFVENNEETINFNSVAISPSPKITMDVKSDEVLYAVPRRYSPKDDNEITTSSASPSPWKSVGTAQTSSKSTAPSYNSFKYPLSFYCKICNNLQSDPRTLDCLHTFCMQCLARLDASNDMQNNQFWRKICEHSETSSEPFLLLNH